MRSEGLVVPTEENDPDRNFAPKPFVNKWVVCTRNVLVISTDALHTKRVQKLYLGLIVIGNILWGRVFHFRHCTNVLHVARQ